MSDEANAPETNTPSPTNEPVVVESAPPPTSDSAPSSKDLSLSAMVTKDAKEKSEKGIESGKEWYIAPGQKGEGERPEFLDPKYESLWHQAEAYGPLQKKLGAQKPIPEKYDLGILDDFGLEINPEDGLASEFLEKAKEAKFTQDQIDTVFDFYSQDLKSRMPLNREQILENLQNDLGTEQGLEAMDVYSRVAQWSANQSHG